MLGEWWHIVHLCKLPLELTKVSTSSRPDCGLLVSSLKMLEGHGPQQDGVNPKVRQNPLYLER